MLWVLQTNFYSEPGYARLVDALERMKLPHVIVKPVPFTHRLLPATADTSNGSVDVESIPEVEVDASQKVIACGSYTLAKIAKRRGWSPGAFIENLNYDAWKAGWGAQRLLNPEARVARLADASFTTTMFVRPEEDSKSFTGKVYEPEEWMTWRDKMLAIAQPGDPLNADTLVVVAVPKVIFTETRLFVVDGRIVTYSQYRRGGRVHYSTEMVDTEVLDFGRECIAAWTPSKAFVVDIAQTPDGCKVVEANCINAAGFYACDTAALVAALEDLAEA